MRWNWAWTPVVVIGTAAVANAAIVVAANRVRPQAVEAHPYASSVRVDADKAAVAGREDRTTCGSTCAPGIASGCRGPGRSICSSMPSTSPTSRTSRTRPATAARPISCASRLS